jgi:hypothetical protein
MQTQLDNIRHFYELLGQLESKLGGTRTLAAADGATGWPERGVYFFFEPGETRSTSGTGPRVVRVGTHALKAGSTTTLWSRLRQHRGNVGGARPDGGNHRGSIFRLHVGTALIGKEPERWPPEITKWWGIGSDAPAGVRDREYPLEQAVSRYIRSMPVLWLAIMDAPGPGSLRGYIERNAIALLSGTNREVSVDPPGPGWLGQWAASQAIQQSGLWNANHVNAPNDPDFLGVLARLVH